MRTALTILVALMGSPISLWAADPAVLQIPIENRCNLDRFQSDKLQMTVQAAPFECSGTACKTFARSFPISFSQLKAKGMTEAFSVRLQELKARFGAQWPNTLVAVILCEAKDPKACQAPSHSLLRMKGKFLEASLASEELSIQLLHDAKSEKACPKI